MKNYLSIDQGTSSTRSIIFDLDGKEENAMPAGSPRLNDR